MYGVDPNDAMIMARTMWGENNNASPDEYSAIANVMRNRLQSGDQSYGGDTMSRIALAHNQFQAWNDPNAKNYPMKAPLRSPAFQSAYQIASSVLGGQSDDPTNGAVNYHATSMKTQPAWAKGRQGQQIGQHTFYGPNPAPDVTNEDQATIDKFYPQKTPQAAPSGQLTDEDNAAINRFYPKTAGKEPIAETPAAKVAGGFEQLPATAMEKPLNGVGPSSETLLKTLGVLAGGPAAFGAAKLLPGLVKTAIPMAAKAAGFGALATAGGALANEVLGPEHGARLMDLVRRIQHYIPEAP